MKELKKINVKTINVKTIKKAVALVLAFAVMAGLVLFTPALRLQTAAVDGEASAIVSASNVFEALGIDTSKASEGSALTPSMSPYGSEMVSIVEVDELFIGGHVTGVSDNYANGSILYGHNMSYEASINDYVSNAAWSATSTGITGRTAATTIRINATSGGFKDYVAVYSATSNGANVSFNLDLIDPLVAGSRTRIAMGISTIPHDEEVLYSPDFMGFMQIASGDVDGDGNTEIVIISHSVVSSRHTAKIIVYKMGATLSSWTGTVVDTLTLGSSTSMFNTAVYNRTTVSLAVGDLNRDGRADIAASFCYPDGSFARAMCQVYYADKEGRFNAVESEIVISRKELLLKRRVGVPTNNPLSPLATADINCMPFMSYGISIADADGMPGNELLVAWTGVGPGNTSSPPNYFYTASVYSYKFAINKSDATNLAKNKHLFETVAVNETHTGTVLIASQWTEYTPLSYGPLQITAVNLDGPATLPFIIINGVEHKCDSKGGIYTPVSGDPAVNRYRYYMPILALDFTGTDGGYLNYYYSDYSKNSSNVNVDYVRHVDKARMVTQVFNKRYSEFGPAFFVATPNTDNDSIIIKLREHRVLYTDPVVLAAIASPPFFKDMAYVSDPAHATDGSTSCGKSHASGTGKTNGSTITAGAYVSVEGKTKTPFSVDAKFEAEAEYHHGWTYEYEETEETTTMITYTVKNGYDMVVLYTIPVDMFVYDAYKPADETGTKYAVLTYTIGIPNSAEETCISIEKYNEVYEMYSDILPNIGEEVFTHTAGKPDTYPKSVYGFRNPFYIRDNNNEEVYSTLGGEGSSVTQTLTISNSTGEVRGHTNGYDFKAGGGVEVGEGSFSATAGVTQGGEWTKGEIVTETESSEYTATVPAVPEIYKEAYDFKWHVFQYEYSKGTQHFPVVTYAVDAVSMPAELPDDFGVYGTSGNSVTLYWTPSRNDTGSMEYYIYVVTEFTNKKYYSDKIPHSDPNFDEDEGVYKTTITGLSPGEKYTFVLQAYAGGTETFRSVYSSEITVTTPIDMGASFSGPPPTVNFDAGTLDVGLKTGFNPGSATNVGFIWMKKNGPGWESLSSPISTVSIYSGTGEDNLNMEIGDVEIFTPSHGPLTASDLSLQIKGLASFDNAGDFGYLENLTLFDSYGTECQPGLWGTMDPGTYSIGLPAQPDYSAGQKAIQDKYTIAVVNGTCVLRNYYLIVVTSQPESVEIYDNEGVTLTVAAELQPSDPGKTLTYQWYQRNLLTVGGMFLGKLIEGATGSSYTIPAGTLSESYSMLGLNFSNYYCIISCDGVCSTVSYAAEVTVRPNPEITVGSQQGRLYRSDEGYVIYNVETKNIPNGAYPVTLTGAPNGFIADAITISDNKGILKIIKTAGAENLQYEPYELTVGFGGAVSNICSLNVELKAFAQNIISINLSGEDGVTSISVDGGALRINADKTVANTFLSSEVVLWSITSGADKADIIGCDIGYGQQEYCILAGKANGAVTVRATAYDHPDMYSEITIAVSGQILQKATSVQVLSETGLYSINANGGTLRMYADISPSNADIQTVLWFITEGREFAEIDNNGLITAKQNGVVTVMASAVDGSGVYGQRQINITGQIVKATGVVVVAEDSVAAVDTDGGSLQLFADIFPEVAADKSVTWAIVDGAAFAAIDKNGLLTAKANGVVTVKATAADGTGVYGEKQILISGQTTYVEKILLTAVGGAEAIITDGGALQLVSGVAPATADDKSVTWSILSGGIFADIDDVGLLRAKANGTVTVLVTANDGSGIYDTLDITISNQNVMVSYISVFSAGSVPYAEAGGDLRLTADAYPPEADNRSVTWCIIDGADYAQINSNGILTAIAAGEVTIRATANDGSGTFCDTVIAVIGETEALLADFSPGAFDIIFMDVFMEGIDGIAVARKIREVDPYCALVIVTSSGEHTAESYSVRAVYYVKKPLTQDEMDNALCHVQAGVL